MSKITNQKSSRHYFDSIKKPKEIVSNSEYILWLEKFTEKYPSFSDDDWLYKEDEISKEDKMKVYDLQFFIKEIDDYAIRNYIAEQSDNLGFYNHYYLIKYNNIGYKISTIIGQDVVDSCERIDKITDDFIDFQDIIDNKKPKSAYVIEDKFDELSVIIKELLELKASKRSIEDVVGKLLR